MLASLDRVAARLVRLAALIGTIGLLVEVVVILTDVVGRGFGEPLRGAQDISIMALVLIVFGGMALCDRIGGHISVDIFERHFPGWMNRGADIVSAVLGAVVFALIAWTMWESAALSEMLNLSTNIINLPKAWFQYAVVVLSLVTALGMALRAVSLSLGQGWPGRDEAEALKDTAE
ncbi:TRAP transporter small permease subunit [Rhodobacterales bacterium HKCCE2091]|nr:TRAP transporter small permease subunit [Rhodobacterales bacterium HKCCE2091]